jgi:hypothetical protein
VLALVAIGVIGVQAIAWSACQLWVTRESAEYLTYAAHIAGGLDFSHPYALYRTPGYPLLLAGVFTLFQADSAAGLLLVQHALVAGCALLAAATAWTLWAHRGLTIVAGILGAGSLHLAGYANAVSPVVLYTFAFTLCLFLLIRYHAHGRVRTLLTASVTAGVAGLTSPIGWILPPLCLVAGVHREATATRRRNTFPRGGAGAFVGTALAATLPAAAVMAPFWLHGQRTFDRFPPAMLCGGALFHRTVAVERLNTAQSADLAELQKRFATAKADGWISADVAFADQAGSLTDMIRTWQLAGGGVPEAMSAISGAGWDLALLNPLHVPARTFPHLARALLTPDDAYRRQPNGEELTPLKPLAVYDFSTMDEGSKPAFARYLVMRAEPGRASGIWAAYTRSYHTRFESRGGYLGLGGTPYAEWHLLGLLGLVFALIRRNRAIWCLLLLAAVGHVGLASFVHGGLPRNAVPVHPILHVFEALAVVEVLRGLAAIPAILLFKWSTRRSVNPRMVL